MVPNDQQLRGQLAQQMSEEVHYLHGVDGVRIQAEIEVAPGHRGRSLEHLAIKVILQRRGLPARRTDACPMEPLAQSAFVEEDDGTTFAQCFLLSLASAESLQIMHRIR
jgi:hypothetical protein